MDRQYIEENHIVDRYLMGQVSEDEASEFEAYYFEHPEMLEEVQIAEAMRDTLREQLNTSRSSVYSQNGLSWFERMFQPKLGFAFTALLSLSVLGLLVQNNQLRTDVGDVFPAPSLTLSLSRGGNGGMPGVRVAQNQQAIVLRLEMGQIGYTDVLMQLRESSGSLVWEGATTVDGPLGTVNLVIAARQLKPGTYELRVIPPAGGDAALSVYEFEVERF